MMVRDASHRIMSPASRFNLWIEHPQVTSKRAQSMRWLAAA
jgi:hypothetical protein